MPIGTHHPDAADGLDRPGLEIDLRPRRDELPLEPQDPGADRFHDPDADRRLLVGQLTRALERAQQAEARVEALSDLLRRCRERIAAAAHAPDDELLRGIDERLPPDPPARA